MDIEALRTGLSLLTSAIGLAKQAKEMLPESKEKKSVEEGLERAERSTKIAEAEIARGLGYQICRCTFPPQIMLKTGFSREYGDHFQCPRCPSTWPPQEDSGEPEFVEDFEP